MLLTNNKGQTYQVEVVADDASRQRGLMLCDSMSAEQGIGIINV